MSVYTLKKGWKVNILKFIFLFSNKVAWATFQITTSNLPKEQFIFKLPKVNYSLNLYKMK